MPLLRTSRVPWFTLLVLALCGAGLTLAGCRSFGSRRAPPVAREASLALAGGRALLRTSPEDRAAARGEFERAQRLAPDWVAPRRALDELARLDYAGVEALRLRRAEIDADPSDAGAWYLAGRLEGRGGEPRFEAAVRTDPSCAWGWHGLSWSASQRGDRDEALEHAERAASLARDPWERAFFAQSIARLEAARGEHAAAAEVLAAAASDEELEAFDRQALELQAVGIALASLELELVGRGYERGLELLHSGSLTDAEVAELVERLRRAPAIDDPERGRLVLALSLHRSPARDRLRGELLLDAAPSPLALELLLSGISPADAAALPAPQLRAARFWNGAWREAVDAWLASLPRVVLDEAGLPRDARLAAVVQRVRALAPRSGALEPAPRSGALEPAPRGGALESAPRAGAFEAGAGQDVVRALTELGGALIECGWFREARGVAAELGRHDLGAALELDARASAGLEFLEGLERALRRIDLRDLRRSSSKRGSPGAPDPWQGLLAERREPARDLDALLVELAEPLARTKAHLGGERSQRRLAEELLASPRIEYAPVGELVHPGPLFSAADERDGLGRRGTPVAGLSSEFAALGRFGLFGELAGGGGPDGTLLPLLWMEERAGEHLGVPWHGTLSWCEAAEVKTRAGRSGAHISAAALHEGYWLDIDSVRGEHALWRALEQEFDGPDARARLEAVLATSGLELEAGDAEARARERRANSALLGEANRVRLALLASRAPHGEVGGEAGAKVLGEVTLDELVRVTGTHEEGHLCDRTRFLPISRHLGAAFVFALECGFSPQRVQEMLEYRAQLTALCDAPDPRVSLAQVLDASEGGLNGSTPHAAGYTLLLEDFLHVFDEELARDPARFPAVDPERTLVHQLHRLTPGELRELALQLARKKRLLRD